MPAHTAPMFHATPDGCRRQRDGVLVEVGEDSLSLAEQAVVRLVDHFAPLADGYVRLEACLHEGGVSAHVALMVHHADDDTAWWRAVERTAFAHGFHVTPQDRHAGDAADQRVARCWLPITNHPYSAVAARLATLLAALADHPDFDLALTPVL